MQAGAAFEERDFFQDPFSEADLRGLMGSRSAADLFSWRSPAFRKMGIDRDSLDDEKLVALMLEEPRLIRRPILAVGGALFIGARPEDVLQALSTP